MEGKTPISPSGHPKFEVFMSRPGGDGQKAAGNRRPGLDQRRGIHGNTKAKKNWESPGLGSRELGITYRNGRKEGSPSKEGL